MVIERLTNGEGVYTLGMESKQRLHYLSENYSSTAEIAKTTPCSNQLKLGLKNFQEIVMKEFC